MLDGDTLCTPENDFEAGHGVVGLWSRKAGYVRTGEFTSGGIGPHDLKRLPERDVLVVANSGILTHPDHGREKLNLDTMTPNLTYLEPSGAILDQIELEAGLHLNSIRHLDILPDGTVAFAMQWQGEFHDFEPLSGLHKRGSAPRLLEAPAGRQAAPKGYAGSVSWNEGGDLVAISSPRGGEVHFFDRSGEFTGHWRRADVCGLRALGRDFLATDGNGALHRISPQGGTPLARTELAWDNHIVTVHG